MPDERSERDDVEPLQASSSDSRNVPDTDVLHSSSVLASGLRHDLLNCVNQIVGYAEMLQEEAEESGHVGIAPDLAKIRTAARRLHELIDLASGRSAAGSAKVSLVAPAARSVPGGGAGALSTQIVEGESAPPASEARLAAPTPSDTSGTAVTAIPSNHPLLIVDDDELNRDVLARRLERQGFSVLLAENGIQALEVMKRQPLDLVLLDVMMPELDGYGVLQHMKSDPHLRELPVIMVSGLSEIDSVVRCIELGAEDYLSKPFNPVLLRARIGACLEKKYLRDQERLHYQALKETQDRLAAELSEAAAYVQSLFPPPLIGEIAADWRFIPSTQLGGDAFGYHWLDPAHFAMYLIDVCGHGVGAALLSVSVINVLRSQALPDTDFRSPAAVLRGLNSAFQMETQNDQYFTIWYGVYDRMARELVYASGGHPPAILINGGAATSDLTQLAVPAFMIGWFPDAVYEEARSRIVPPASLCIFSDGLYEVARTDETMLDFAQFLEILRRPAEGSGESRVDRVIRELRQFAGSDTFQDDCSFLEISFQG